MNKLKFKKNSWHYKLALFASEDNLQSIPDNFCSYFWKVILGIFMFTMTIIFGIILTFVTIVSPLLYLFVGIQYEFFLPIPVEVVIGLAVDSIVFVLNVMYQISEWRETKRQKDYDAWEANGYKHQEKTPSFIQTSWNTFKDKTCFKIEFE